MFLLNQCPPDSSGELGTILTRIILLVKISSCSYVIGISLESLIRYFLIAFHTEHLWPLIHSSINSHPKETACRPWSLLVLPPSSEAVDSAAGGHLHRWQFVFPFSRLVQQAGNTVVLFYPPAHRGNRNASLLKKPPILPVPIFISGHFSVSRMWRLQQSEVLWQWNCIPLQCHGIIKKYDKLRLNLCYLFIYAFVVMFKEFMCYRLFVIVLCSWLLYLCRYKLAAVEYFTCTCVLTYFSIFIVPCTNSWAVTYLCRRCTLSAHAHNHALWNTSSNKPYLNQVSHIGETECLMYQ